MVDFDRWWLQISEGEFPSPIRPILGCLSHCHRMAVSLRNLAYDSILPARRLSVPVISVGNIVAGGTGKTPLVRYLAEQLAPMQVAILSRGYGRRERAPLVVNSRTAVYDCGDEAAWLAQNLPGVSVIVGAKRIRTGALAISHGAEVILLDDGMQHRQLHRDIEIVAVNRDPLFGRGHFLPLGILRDHPKRLARADLIVCSDLKSREEFDLLECELKRYTEAPLVCLKRKIKQGENLVGKRVAVFSAIAQPSRFIATLEEGGAVVVLHKKKLDHSFFTQEELETFVSEGLHLGAEWIVCTEKDGVKLSLDICAKLSIRPIAIGLEAIFGALHLENLIQRVRS